MSGVVRYFLALGGGEPVGCVGLKRLSRDEGEVKTLHVAREGRREGVAKALLARLTRSAKGLGMTTLKLETSGSEGFAAFRRFYTAAGFAACGRVGPYREGDVSCCIEKKI